MKIDAHQHFWVYDEAQYPWIPKGSPLHRDWLPNHLAQEQTKIGFDGSIAVQARQTIEDSHWLLTLADHAPLIKGVVGWVDLRSAKVEEQLAQFASHQKFVGIRHVVQDETDDFLVLPDFVRGVSKLRSFKLTYDLLVRASQLPAAIELVRRLPEQKFVLDHAAKPPIREGKLSPWRENVEELAKLENVVCKASGLVTEADHGKWRADDIKPYLDVIFMAFGPDRIMFGSDWPVCLLAANYAQVYRVVDQYTSGLSAAQREAVFGGNAMRFYTK